MNINTGNAMRVGGLASGIDTEEIVSQLMEAERAPLIKLEQDQQRISWKTDAFRDINTQLKELDDIVNEMKYSKSYKSKSTSTSDDGAVTANANSSASEGTYNIKVDQLASGEIHAGNTGSIDSETFKANEGTYKFSMYDENGEKQTYQFDVEEDDNLNDVLKKINNAGEGNVRASYDASSKRVIMETTRTGVYNPGTDSDNYGGEIIFEDNFFEDTLKLTNRNDAQNAKFEYNGLETESKENNYTINNIHFTFNNVTDGNTRVTVTNNVDDAYDNIKNFVDKYNEIIDTMNTSQREEKHRNFPPLTKEQEEEMTDREIEKWEEKAKSGILRGESSIRNGMLKMRQSTQAKVDTDGAYSLLSQIGITTTGDYQDGGKLEIDEGKLKEALSNNADDVYELFVNSSEGEGRGLINRFDDALDQTKSQIESKAGKSYQSPDNYSLGREMKRLDTRVETFEKRMETIENRYWKQFTAMEKAISRMNQQADYMFSQFGDGM